MSDAVEFAGREPEQCTAERRIEFVSHERVVRGGRIHVAPDPLQLERVVDGAAAARLEQTRHRVTARVGAIGGVSDVARAVERRSPGPVRDGVDLRGVAEDQRGRRLDVGVGIRKARKDRGLFGNLLACKTVQLVAIAIA